MMSKSSAFKFLSFSKKQLKLLTWWNKKSPYYDYDMIICDGSVRSGKTVAMILSFVLWTQSAFDNQAFIIASKSIGALKRNILRPMFQILAAKGVAYRYNRTDHYIQIGTNTYYCFGASNEASQDVLQGLTAAGAFADEVALFPESFVEQMIARCSIDGSKIWMNCNPESPYHFIKTDFIDQAREKRILHLHFTLDDNLSLSESIKERYKRLYSGLWFKRMILGLWVLAEGVIYDMWDEVKHVIKQVPKLDHEWVTIDYGTGNPTAFLHQGFNETLKKYFTAREYYYSSRETGIQKTDAEYSKDLQSFTGGKRMTAIVDPSAASFIAQLRKDGFLVIEADNSVLDGIRWVASLMQNEEYAVHESCRNCIEENATYVWDEKAQEKGIDKPVKQKDHAKDAERYGLYTKRHLIRRKDTSMNTKVKTKYNPFNR
jgi:PBSX family phage terminase large subunit